MVTGACQHTSSKMCSRPRSEAPRAVQATCTAVALENACGVDSNITYAPKGCHQDATWMPRQHERRGSEAASHAHTVLDLASCYALTGGIQPYPHYSLGSAPARAQRA